MSKMGSWCSGNSGSHFNRKEVRVFPLRELSGKAWRHLQSWELGGGDGSDAGLAFSRKRPGCPKAGIIWCPVELECLSTSIKEFLELNPKPSLPSMALQSRLSPRSLAYLTSFAIYVHLGIFFGFRGSRTSSGQMWSKWSHSFIFSTGSEYDSLS